MFSLQMPRITFFLRNGILYCRVSFQRTTSEFSTNERLEPEYWLQDLQRYNSKSKPRNKFVETLIESLSYKIKSVAMFSECTSAKSLIQSMMPTKKKKKKGIGGKTKMKN